MRVISKLHGLAALVFCVAGVGAQTYTPTEYNVTLHEVALSSDGSTWRPVFESSGGLAIDLANPATFASVFGSARPIPAGSYDWIRMVLDDDLGWSYPNAPISLSNQTFTVSGGPPGPSAGLMSVHFATREEGGKPNGQGGGEGTTAKPFLLGAPAVIAADVDTTLRLVFVITGALSNQGGGYDLGPPQMYFVTENGDVSSLSGTFNTVLYNSIKRLNTAGNAVVDWQYESGHGTLDFDGSGAWTWSGTQNDFDLQGGATGAVTTSVARSGRYGVNSDGSFWMIANGEPGTLRGATSSDGTMIVATMYDSPSSHLMVYGVQQATSASVSSMTGGYYFTTYGNSWNGGSTQLSYTGNFGTVTANGSGGITGSSDSNELVFQDPTGTPSVVAPTTSLSNSITDTLTVSSSGVMGNTGNRIGGGVLESGDAACIAFAFESPYSPTNEFGFIVRQSTSGTFSAASLSGTYFGGHFGDIYESGTGSSTYYSGFFQVTFDGVGSASVTLFENREGVVVEDSFTQNYAVDSATGVVTLSDPGSGVSEMMGGIGPNAMSLILSSQQVISASPADQRFLGLALKQ